MNRHEYVAELKKRLKKLPFDEVKSAVDYYEEYFDEAGEDKEQEAILELGSPAQVSSKIIANFALKDNGSNERSPHRSLSKVWIILLAIFASPIALPLALVAVVLVLVVVIVLVVIVLALGVTGIALALSGICVAVMSMFLIIGEFATALFFIGVGLIASGVGLMFLMLTFLFAKTCFPMLIRQMSKFLIRRTV